MGKVLANAFSDFQYLVKSGLYVGDSLSVGKVFVDVLIAFLGNGYDGFVRQVYFF